MDLLKMHPMARKMAVHSEAFAKALEDGNATEAKDHINEVIKFAGYLSEDIHTAIVKSKRENIEYDFEPVNPMLRKMNESGQKFDVSQRGQVLPGTIIPAKTQRSMRVHRGTFGRFVPDS
jgi:hypothetical protein